MGKVVVMTWNMNNLNDGTVDNLKGMLKEFSPDICCLQEGAPQISKLDKRYCSLPSLEHSGTEGKGIEIGWRKSTFNRLTAPEHFDSNDGKNTPYSVDLQTLDGEVVVYVTTWHASGEKVGSRYDKAFQTFDKFYLSNDTREKVKDAVENDNIWLTLGDFNTEGWRVQNVITNPKNLYVANNYHNGCHLDNIVIKSGMDIELKPIKLGHYNDFCGSDCHKPFFRQVDFSVPSSDESSSSEESSSSDED